MGNVSPRLCMCGREVEKESPSQFICLYCSIKHIIVNECDNADYICCLCLVQLFNSLRWLISC